MAVAAERPEVIQSIDFGKLVPPPAFSTDNRRFADSISSEMCSILFPVGTPTNRRSDVDNDDVINKSCRRVAAQRRNVSKLRDSNRKRRHSSSHSDSSDDVPRRKEYSEDDVIANGNNLADISRISMTSRSHRRASCDFAMEHFMVTMTSSPAFTSSQLNSTFNYPLHSTLLAPSDDVEQNSTSLISRETTSESSLSDFSSSVSLDSADFDVTVEPEVRRVMRSALFVGQLRELSRDDEIPGCSSTGNQAVFHRDQPTRRPFRVTSSNRIPSRQLVPNFESEVQPVCRVQSEAVGDHRRVAKAAITKPEVELRLAPTNGVLTRQTGSSRLVPETTSSCHRPSLVPTAGDCQDGHLDDVIVRRRRTSEMKRRIQDFRREMMKGRISGRQQAAGLKLLAVV